MAFTSRGFGKVLLSFLLLPLLLSMLLSLLLFPAGAAAKAFRVQEGDFVKINAEAVDLDQDEIIFSYSSPLDQHGEWQTTLDDAGEYFINVTVSDGENRVTRVIQLIVENTNQPPSITVPALTVRETEEIYLPSLVQDPDGDVLTFKFNSPFDSRGSWTPGYEGQGSFVTIFTANDGFVTKELRLAITVENRNKAPDILDTFSRKEEFEVQENAMLQFWVNAEDIDGDVLQYEWILNGQSISSGPSGEHFFDYESAGKYELAVHVSDGHEAIARSWSLRVENLNRPPEFSLPAITLAEGDKLRLELPAVDADLDAVIYSFEPPLDEYGEWQTSFENAGEYLFTIRATDGIASVNKTLALTVRDVDRPPSLVLPEKVYVREGESAAWAITALDPDGDKLGIQAAQLPPGAELDQQAALIRWSPSYDTIRRRGGVVSNFLNSIRLENFLLRRKTFPITVTACGRELCSSQQMSIVVYNTNRPPQFAGPLNLTVMETEEVHFAPSAQDPDNDLVHYYFTSPLQRRSGKWQTDHGDEGIYISYLTATDGREGTTVPVEIRVLKLNREPVVKVPAALRSGELRVSEGQEAAFSVSASDPDGDNVTLWVENLPEGASFRQGVFRWTPSFEEVQEVRNGSSRSLQLLLGASDAEFDAVYPLLLTVENVNRPPEIAEFTPAKSLVAKVGEALLFEVAVVDPDGDELQYEWDFGWRQQKVRGAGVNAVLRSYVEPGEKRVSVRISDGREEVQQEWVVRVREGAPGTSGTGNFSGGASAAGASQKRDEELLNTTSLDELSLEELLERLAALEELEELERQG